MQAVNNLEVFAVQYEQFDNEAILYGRVNKEKQPVRLIVKQAELNRMICQDTALMQNWDDSLIETHDLGDTTLIEMNIHKRTGNPLRVNNYEFRNSYKLIRA